MAVFEHISNALTEDILGVLLDESDLSLLSFDNQVVGVESVPDAAIRSSVSVWFETKTERDAVNQGQLERHLAELERDGAELQRLVVLTPDEKLPREVEGASDERLVWVNFDALVDAVESLLERVRGNTETSTVIPTEREAFLLRELVRFIYDEDLTGGSEDRVLVVAARKAWPEFHDHGLYFCQPGRSFRNASHLAFYTDGEVKREIPHIEEFVDDIVLTEDGVEQADLTDEQRERLIAAVEEMRENGAERYGEEQQVAFLGEGIELERVVENNKTASDSDRRVAFVQGHRYVSLSALEDEPEYTSILE
ncbi:hypothetical protein [Halococcus hamelinensis]|uniref:PD-(D/E)XK nuclease superfamily protein n=1 Tax=Halococcus hamelinensis 100A6 TaxID=1132509 RepID=M0M9W3_9EURY|nr:hypothetical protein [Halococcus hamelinensis]EMA41424.1 hypothetical protein C447_01180 [Halococcus hamelinensis 100A6]